MSPLEWGTFTLVDAYPTVTRSIPTVCGERARRGGESGDSEEPAESRLNASREQAALAEPYEDRGAQVDPECGELGNNLDRAHFLAPFLVWRRYSYVTFTL